MGGEAREEVIWYYRLGDQTLGPVPWTEIEALIRDSLDADRLLVARGGDAEWRTAAEVLAAHPELAGVPEAAAEGDEPTTPPTVEPQAHAPIGAGPVPVEFGIGRWISQAWQVVISDVWTWMAATLLVFLIGALTASICAIPMAVGLYMMALRRFEGERVGAGDVFQGFQRFWSALGLWLLMMVPTAVLMLPFLVMIMGMVVGAHAIDEDMMPFMVMGIYALYPVLWLAMLGVQTIFFY